jgi:hypothetical protein
LCWLRGLSRREVRFQSRMSASPGGRLWSHPAMSEAWGCAQQSTELFPGKIFGVELRGVTRISGAVAQGDLGVHSPLVPKAVRVRIC